MQYRPTEVNISLIKVNAMDRGAGLHLSTNCLQKRFSKIKKTQGLGENNGDRSTFISTMQSVQDADVFDLTSLYKRG